MGRNKTYDKDDVLNSMKTVFLRGYESCSLDDLVKSTGLLRGSLYTAFGSKANMFKETLVHNISIYPDSSATWELVIIGLVEVAPHNCDIQNILATFLNQFSENEYKCRLANTIIRRSKIQKEGI